MKRPEILVAHPWVANGGSEATTMWTLRALQDDFDVTLVTAGDVDFEKLNKTFDSKVNAGRIKVINAPRLPGVKTGMNFVALQHAYFQRFCRSIAGDFDLCISGYNFVPYGQPSIQLIGDFSFSEELRQRFYIHEHQKYVHKASLIRSIYLKVRDVISEGLGYEDAEGLVLANSVWTARKLVEHCDMECDVLYPPVAMPLGLASAEPRKENSFFYIGRVSPEKEIEKIISILDMVREKGHAVTLDLAGNSHRSAYETMIAELAEARPWVNDLGYLSGDAKEAAFARSAFGIQACRCEAFGIAAAEMASRGCLPLVAAGCGPAEVVPFEALQFSSVDDAAAKIIALLEDPELADDLRQKTIEGTHRFSAVEFVVKLQGFVDSMLKERSSSNPTTHVANQKGMSALH